MQFLLDTNICIYIIKRKPQQVFDRFQRLSLSNVGVSSITVAELEYGAYKSQRLEQNRAALRGRFKRVGLSLKCNSESRLQAPER